MDMGRHELGMIGLGVMGRNMLLNMADHGFPVVGYDKDASQVEALQKEAAAATYTPSPISGISSDCFVGRARL